MTSEAPLDDATEELLAERLTADEFVADDPGNGRSTHHDEALPSADEADRLEQQIAVPIGDDER